MENRKGFLEALNGWLESLATMDCWQLSYWDAAIVEAARTLGCEEVLSEDLNSGQDFDGVRAVNPFAE